ncbi:hypothetical protein L9F63_020815, partial [Diploptera punctata]
APMQSYIFLVIALLFVRDMWMATTSDSSVYENNANGIKNATKSTQKDILQNSDGKFAMPLQEFHILRDVSFATSSIQCKSIALMRTRAQLLVRKYSCLRKFTRSQSMKMSKKKSTQFHNE